MLDEHQCCDFDNFCAKWEYVVKGYQRCIFSLGGHTRITTGVPTPRSNITPRDADLPEKPVLITTVLYACVARAGRAQGC